MAKNYRWDSVYKWLAYSVTEKWDAARTRVELLEIAAKCDPDDLQDLFQADMEEDGYFDEVDQ